MHPASSVVATNPTFYVLKSVGGGKFFTLTPVQATAYDASVTYYTTDGNNYSQATTVDESNITSYYTISATAATGTYNSGTTYYTYEAGTYTKVDTTDWVNGAPLNMDADNRSFAANTTFEVTNDESEGGPDYIKKTVYIKSTGDEAEHLIANISVVSGGTGALDPSLRVMLVTNIPQESGSPIITSRIYRAIDFATTSYNAISGINSTLATAQESSVTPVANDTEIASIIYADTVNQIDIYIWYEGQDPACKATNAVTLVDTTFSFSFYCA